MKVPNPTAFSTANVNENEGYMVLIGGKTKKDISSEVWRLDLEKIISYTNNPQKTLNTTQIWEKYPDKLMSTPRYGHKSVFLHPNSVFIFGGINDK